MATGSYTVTSQAVDQYDFSAPGNPVLGTVVYFVTGNGHQGSVFVPQALTSRRARYGGHWRPDRR
jgi:hypothetical protein